VATLVTASANATPFELPFAVQGSWDDPLLLPDAQILIHRSGAAAPLLEALRARRDTARVPPAETPAAPAATSPALKEVAPTPAPLTPTKEASTPPRAETDTAVPAAPAAPRVSIPQEAEAAAPVGAAALPERDPVPDAPDGEKVTPAPAEKVE
jgi:AsmA protein